MKQIRNLAVIVCALLLLSSNAFAVPMCGAGGGLSTSPLTAGREFGPNQWQIIQYTNSQQQPATSFSFLKGALSGFLYNGTPGGVFGFTDRHVLEGIILNSTATPATDCNLPITQGSTGPCPNTDYVPDACPDLDTILGQALEYPYRAFGTPSTYATIVWGATANNLADAGTINITNKAVDFVGPTTPPFANGAFDNKLPNVATNPYTGPLSAGDLVMIETPSGPFFGNIDHVADQLTSFTPSSDPRNPAYRLYKTTLSGGKFIDITSKIFDMGRSGSPVYTTDTVDSKGKPCYQLIGILESAGETFFGTRVTMYQSFSSNIQPALLAADGHTYTPTGNCVAVGPKTLNGNVDSNGLTQNTPCNTDLAMAAQTNIFNMLASKCTAPSGHTCGTTTWGSVIQSALVNANDGYVDIGYTNSKTDIAHPFLHVTYVCTALNECDATAVKNAIMAKTNSTGTTVSTALANWGITNTATAAQMVTLVPTYPSTSETIVSDYQN